MSRTYFIEDNKEKAGISSAKPTILVGNNTHGLPTSAANCSKEFAAPGDDSPLKSFRLTRYHYDVLMP